MPPRTRRPRNLSWSRRLLIGLLAASVLLAGWSGWSVWRAVHATPVRYAHAREAVLAAGTHAVRTLNTVDYHHAAQDLAAWRAVAAGGLAKRLADRHISDEHGVRRVRAITTARVLDTGVSELDLHAGTATLLATVRTTVDTRGTKKGKHKGKPHTRHQADHLVVTMTHTGSGWKATGMRVVGGAA